MSVKRFINNDCTFSVCILNYGFVNFPYKTIRVLGNVNNGTKYHFI